MPDFCAFAYCKVYAGRKKVSRVCVILFLFPAEILTYKRRGVIMKGTKIDWDTSIHLELIVCTGI